MTESRRAVRNAGLLMGQRAVHVVIAALFALLVPRLMGPEIFGKYALFTSVSMWFGLLSGLGAVSLMTRQVPQFVASGDLAGLKKFITNLLALRVSTGALTGTAYFLFVAFALDEGNWAAIACIAGAVLTRTVANLCFSLFLGLNQAARWGIGELMRRGLILAGVFVGYPAAGLTGACAGFLLANVIVLVIGLAGAREYLVPAVLDLRRVPHRQHRRPRHRSLRRARVSRSRRARPAPRLPGAVPADRDVVCRRQSAADARAAERRDGRPPRDRQLRASGLLRRRAQHLHDRRARLVAGGHLLRADARRARRRRQ